jgi:hypothetical protein
MSLVRKTIDGDARVVMIMNLQDFVKTAENHDEKSVNEPHSITENKDEKGMHVCSKEEMDVWESI